MSEDESKKLFDEALDEYLGKALRTLSPRIAALRHPRLGLQEGTEIILESRGYDHAIGDCVAIINHLTSLVEKPKDSDGGTPHRP